MKTRLTSTARAEIDDILSHIADDNPAAAHDVSVALYETIARLGQFPRLAAETDVPGVYMFPALPYRYLVFCSTEKETVIIRNVRHSAREQLY
jgi:plasmid stabilization system protein ParE